MFFFYLFKVSSLHSLFCRMNRANYKFAKCQRKLLGPLASVHSECRCSRKLLSSSSQKLNVFDTFIKNESLLLYVFYFHSVVLCCVSLLFLYRLWIWISLFQSNPGTRSLCGLLIPLQYRVKICHFLSV